MKQRIGGAEELLDLTPYQLLRLIGVDPRPKQPRADARLRSLLGEF